MNPAALTQLLQTGLRHHQAGRFDEAARCYGRVLAAQPRHFEALLLDGTRSLQQGKLADAVKTLRRARAIDGKSAICALRLGIAAAALADWGGAEEALHAAAKLDPRLPEAPFHLGQLLRRQGRNPAALAAFEQAIALKPDYAEAYDQAGALVATWRGQVAAEPWLRKATELDPKLATAWCNLGVSLTFAGRYGEALAAIGKALELRPQFDHAHAARGFALAKLYQHEPAVQAYDRAIACNAQNFDAHSARLMELHYSESHSAEALFREHVRFGEAAAEAAKSAAPAQSAAAVAKSGGRLRIGFLSRDFVQHAVAYFLEPLLVHLNRARFEVYLYHDQDRRDQVSERFAALADCWRVTAGLPGDAFVGLVRGDDLDVLIDLGGHTGLNRLPALARRLAPVQATYLGYPNTTGLAAIDYRLVDAITDPVGVGERLNTEKVIRLPDTAWCYAPPPESPLPAAAPSAGSAPTTFGSFNNFAKVSDHTLRLWSRVLAVVPGSKLLVKGHGLGNDVLRAAAFKRFEAAGIAAANVELMERTASVVEHLAAYSRVDVALDTFPYHGTTTTCEALWMGVPVITLMGERHASRVSCSLLTAVGRPQWIARTDDEYVALAVDAAMRAKLDTAPREALRTALQQSPVMDHKRQAANFGAALETMTQRALSAPAGLANPPPAGDAASAEAAPRRLADTARSGPALAGSDTGESFRRGLQLSAEGRWQEAAEAFAAATASDASSAGAWCNLALACVHLGRIEEAEAAVGRACSLQPDFSHAHAVRGLVYAKSHRSAAAIEAYAQAIRCDPRNFGAYSARLMELQYQPGLTPAALAAEHRRFGEAVEASIVAQSAVTQFDPTKQRLRVGIVSPDLHQHSVAYFLEPLLHHLDRQQFEIYLYHDSAKEDETSARLRALATVWRSIAGQTMTAAEATITADQLDIAIDLTGHAGNNRLPLFARRLAAVQVSYLGYPDTTGLKAIDYRLVDPITDPASEDTAVGPERRVRFAPALWSYAPPADAPEPAPSPAAVGAPVTFGCFNNLSKISDPMLRVWAQILAEVPGSRLLLKASGLSLPAVKAALWERLEKAGLERHNVLLADQTPSVRQHLAAYALVDVALDPFPYNGATTTCEALWMGVPVVTRTGDRHATRVGASLLTAIGRPGWIADNDGRYIAIARDLAAAAGQSRERRTALREAMRHSVLMDHPGQAARWGSALTSLWRTQSADAYLREGNRLKAAKQYREALDPLTQATALAPHLAAAWLNRGVAHLELNEREAAWACFQPALKLEPQRAEAHNIAGHCLLLLGRCEEAAGHLREALRLKPGYAAAHDNLGRVLKTQGEAEEAIAQHRMALQAAPKASTHSNLLYALNLVDVPTDEVFHEHCRWAERYATAPAPVRALHTPRRPGPLRIGFVSADFCAHAIAFFLEPVLEHRRAGQCETFCYSDVKAPDRVTARLRSRADHWRDTAALDTAALAAAIHADAIDVLVDLAGHTAGNRLGVFALRPAATQVTWLGYPNTTGLSQIDYRLTDAVADPDGDACHTERLIRLPGPFSVYRPPEHAPAADRLPGEDIVFGSFNHLAKLSPRTVAVWSRVMAAVPAARLLLKSRGLDDPDTCQRVTARFAAHGIKSDRLLFDGTERGVYDHLALYGRIDVALDPFPYNGATTTCEALWMGVPVVTLRGDRHAGRVGAAMLTHAGFTADIAEDEASYVARAVALAGSRRSSGISASRRESMAGSVLCDGPRFAQAFEDALISLATAHGKFCPVAA